MVEIKVQTTTKQLESKLVVLFCNNSPKLKFLSGWTPIGAMCTRLSVQIRFTRIENMLFSNIFQWRIHVLDKERDAGGFPHPQDVFVVLPTLFLVCRLDKLLGWLSTQTSVVNFRYYLSCLCNVRRQYLLPGILGIYCFLTGIPSLAVIALPKGRICSLVNQVYTYFSLMSLPPVGSHWPNVG